MRRSSSKKQNKNRQRRRRKPGFIARLLQISAIFTACMLLFVSYLGWQMYVLPKRNDDTIVILPLNSSITKIGDILYEERVIHDEFVFTFCYKLMHAISGKHIIAGEYLVPEGVRPYKVLQLLMSGNVIKRQVTIPEGLTIKQMIAILDQTYGLFGEVTANEYLEGNLMPETYQYVYGTQKRAILDRMQSSMQNFLASVWENRLPSHLLQTPEEALILASIVELEAAVPEERGRIAAAYLGRLKIGMRLQADPTVLYAVSQGSNNLGRALLYKDLQHDSPYNTYRYTGLPPTAIASPGKDSIMAVLQSSPSEELFFVADGTGKHNFAKNYREHQRNVQYYRTVR